MSVCQCVCVSVCQCVQCVQCVCVSVCTVCTVFMAFYRFGEDLKLAVDDGDMPIASTFLVTQPPKRLMTTPPDAGSRPIPFPVRTKRPHSASATVHTSLQDDVESLVKEMKRARYGWVVYSGPGMYVWM